jgi:hypothetical protein
VFVSYSPRLDGAITRLSASVNPRSIFRYAPIDDSMPTGQFTSGVQQEIKQLEDFVGKFVPAEMGDLHILARSCVRQEKAETSTVLIKEYVDKKLNGKEQAC